MPPAAPFDKETNEGLFSRVGLGRFSEDDCDERSLPEMRLPRPEG